MLYDFLNTKTGEMETHSMSFTKLDEFKEQNPHLEQRILKAPSLARDSGDIQSKMDDGWKENLSRIAEAHPTSALADKVGGRDTKTVKTQEAIKKRTGNKVLKGGTNYGLDKVK